MKHIFFALFDNTEEVEAAMQAVAEEGIERRDYRVMSHHGRLRDGDLGFHETDGREGIVGGSLIGAVSGALTAGVLFGPLGVIVPSAALAALVGAVFGGTMGALMGGLAGYTMPDHALDRLAKALGEGKVLMTVTVEGKRSEKRMEHAFRRSGARVVRKPMVP